MKKLKINEAIQIFKKNNPNVKMDKTVLADKIDFKSYTTKSIAQLLSAAINGRDKNVPFEIIRQTAYILGVSLDYLTGEEERPASTKESARLLSERLEHSLAMALDLEASLTK